MGDRRHLSKAPIKEALIDIQFEPNANPPDLSSIAADLSTKGSPDIKDIWQALFELKFESNELPQSSHSDSSIGKRVDFPELFQVLQLKPSSFTFSRLPQYIDWDDMSVPAFLRWQAFAEKYKPKRVTRLALRYINALELPLPFNGFDTYLEAPPIVPSGLPQTLSGFLTRIAIPRDGSLAQVTQALQGMSSSGQALSFLFDIEVVQECSLEPNDLDSMRTILDKQRDFKNEIFFKMLTNKTLELYE